MVSGKRQLQMGAGQARDEQSSSRLPCLCLCLCHHGLEVSQCALLSKGPVLPCPYQAQKLFPREPHGWAEATGSLRLLCRTLIVGKAG